MVKNYDEFLNESKGKSREKLSFEKWWNRTYEKKSDYWVSKQELRQGYTDSDLTHYKERKMKSKYNKYLKRKRK